MKVGLLFCAIIATVVCCIYADSAVFKFIEDSTLDQILLSARNRFMATRPFSPPDRLDAAILIPEEADPSGRIWRRGTYNANELAYPASCVKLAYMVGAMHWLHEHACISLL